MCRRKMLLLSCLLALGFTALPAAAQVNITVEIGVPPPPPRVEVMPPPRQDYVWAPGYWRWKGREHVWVAGRWVRDRPGYAWAPERWEEKGRHYRFVPGQWVVDKDHQHWKKDKKVIFIECIYFFLEFQTTEK